MKRMRVSYLSLRHRAIELMVLLAGAWVLWYGLVMPGQQAMARWHQYYQRGQTDYDEQARMMAYAASHTARTGWQQAQQRWQQLFDDEPVPLEVRWAVDGPIECLRLHHEVIQTHGHYAQTRVQITLQGDFPALMNWLDVRCGAEHTLELKALTLTYLDSERSGPWQLAMDASLWAFHHDVQAS